MSAKFPNKIHILLGMFGAFGCLLASSNGAYADINYTFVKLNCDVAEQTATISSFYDWNDAGKVLSESPEKNTYYLNDLSDNKKKISCDIVNNNVLSFEAKVGDSPKNNDLRLYLDDHVIGTYALGYGPLNLSIHIVGDHVAEIKYCPNSVTLLRDADRKLKDELTRSKAKKCEFQTYTNGLRTGTVKFVDP